MVKNLSEVVDVDCNCCCCGLPWYCNQSEVVVGDHLTSHHIFLSHKLFTEELRVFVPNNSRRRFSSNNYTRQVNLWTLFIRTSVEIKNWSTIINDLGSTGSHYHFQVYSLSSGLGGGEVNSTPEKLFKRKLLFFLENRKTRYPSWRYNIRAQNELELLKKIKTRKIFVTCRGPRQTRWCSWSWGRRGWVGCRRWLCSCRAGPRWPSPGSVLRRSDLGRESYTVIEHQQQIYISSVLLYKQRWINSFFSNIF